MNKVTILLKVVGVVLLGAIAVFSALFLIGIGLMGDKYCLIEIKNEGREQLILKTFQYTIYDKKLTVDSIALNPNEKLKIGRCINCSTPDTLDIDFDAISFYGAKMNSKMMYRASLIECLETKDKEGCITYIIR